MILLSPRQDLTLQSDFTVKVDTTSGLKAAGWLYFWAEGDNNFINVEPSETVQITPFIVLLSVSLARTNLS